MWNDSRRDHVFQNRRLATPKRPPSRGRTQPPARAGVARDQFRKILALGEARLGHSGASPDQLLEFDELLFHISLHFFAWLKT
jgi:hypothetical protein